MYSISLLTFVHSYGRLTTAVVRHRSKRLLRLIKGWDRAEMIIKVFIIRLLLHTWAYSPHRFCTKQSLLL